MDVQEGPDYERLGAKRLTLIDVLAQSVGFMGPVFSSAFIIPLIIGVNFAARGAGTSAALAVVLAAIGVYALGWIVAQYAKRIHAAGSRYDYVSNGLGRTVGAATGWLYYGGTIILTVGLGVLLGGYVHDNLLPAYNVGPWVSVWVWDATLTALLFVVLYFGVRISTRVQLTLALVSIAVVLIFFITVIAQLGGDNDVLKALDPTPTPGGFSGILFGAVYVGAAVASTRGVFAMARDRRFPAVMASVSKGHGTPVGSIMLLIAIQVVVIVVAEANDTLLALPELPHYFSVFVWCATFGGFALIVVYLLMSVGALRGLADHPNKAGLWISALLGIVITLAAIFGAFYKVTSPTLLAPWAALIWGAIGLLYMFAVKGREPARVALPELRTHQE